jgi:SsrA-binding protein
MAAKNQKAEPNVRLVTSNRKARHNYHILETIEAGLVLVGTEVKSLRLGKCNLVDSYARIAEEEVFLEKMHISPYDQAHRFNHDPTRTRKLLLHRREIRRLIGKIQEKGLTLIPLRVYFRGRTAKVELGLARGKRQYDKREAITRRESEREIRRSVFRRR